MTTSIKPKVSVLMTFMNGSEMSRYSLESVLWQTLQNFEVWIIGDEGSDAMGNFLSAFGNDPRVRSCNVAPHSSPGFEGMRRARAEYIAWITPGHIWLPEHLQELSDHLDNTRGDVALSIMQSVHSGTKSSLIVPELPDLPGTPDATTVMYRKDAIERLGFMATGMEFERYSRQFLCAALRNGMHIAVVPALTAIKFPGLNIFMGTLPQQRYIEKIKRDPLFVKRELAAMLIRYDEQFRQLPSFYRLFCIGKRWVVGSFAKLGVKERWSQLMRVVFKRRLIDQDDETLLAGPFITLSSRKRMNGISAIPGKE